jgi:hypothetical protein
MLEQVGECFEPVPRLRTAVIGNSRVKALTYYGPPGLDDDRILAVYALRCAFAHDYGLNHMGLDKQAAKMRHTFMLRDDDAAPFIQLPSIRWNGDHQRLGYRGTEVNVRKLGNPPNTSMPRCSARRIPTGSAWLYLAASRNCSNASPSSTTPPRSERAAQLHSRLRPDGNEAFILLVIDRV